MLGRSLFTAIAGLLCGCATTYHEPPSDAPTARVMFKNVSAPGMVEFYAHSDNDFCGGILVLLPAFSVHQGQEVEMRFSAARDLTLSANWGTSDQSCRIYVTFRPLAGHRYAALYGHEGEKCQFVVLHERTDAAESHFEKEASFRVRSGNPMPLGTACAPETE